jgi:anti-sigma regulatory factor (Ser/Thr protein kinase)
VIGRFSRDVDAPRGARALLEEISVGLDEGECADLNIAISELVTNAVVHGAGSVTVRICRTGDSVRIEVTDGGAAQFDWPEAPEAGAQSGLGLHIVETFTDRAGIDCGGPTTVWCERDLAA